MFPSAIFAQCSIGLEFAQMADKKGEKRLKRQSFPTNFLHIADAGKGRRAESKT